MDEGRTFETMDAAELAANADALLEEIETCEEKIKEAERECEALISRYNAKIYTAKELCEKKCRFARESIALLTEELRRYAETQVTGKKRSVQLPSGTLSFRKQEPKFFFDDLKEANAQDSRLIGFARQNAPEYLIAKVEESMDWAKFKHQLVIDDGGGVSFKETGEIIEGLHAKLRPDKFTVKLR